MIVTWLAILVGVHRLVLEVLQKLLVDDVMRLARVIHAEDLLRELGELHGSRSELERSGGKLEGGPQDRRLMVDELHRFVHDFHGLLNDDLDGLGSRDDRHEHLDGLGGRCGISDDDRSRGNLHFDDGRFRGGVCGFHFGVRGFRHRVSSLGFGVGGLGFGVGRPGFGVGAFQSRSRVPLRQSASQVLLT